MHREDHIFNDPAKADLLRGTPREDTEYRRKTATAREKPSKSGTAVTAE
jgi:hypothetical protein